MNKSYVYECIECHHIMLGNRDGLLCSKCNGMINPIREATKEDISVYKEKNINIDKIIKYAENILGHKLYSFQIEMINKVFNK